MLTERPPCLGAVGAGLGERRPLSGWEPAWHRQQAGPWLRRGPGMQSPARLFSRRESSRRAPGSLRAPCSFVPQHPCALGTPGCRLSSRGAAAEGSRRSARAAHEAGAGPKAGEARAGSARGARCQAQHAQRRARGQLQAQTAASTTILRNIENTKCGKLDNKHWDFHINKNLLFVSLVSYFLL